MKKRSILRIEQLEPRVTPDVALGNGAGAALSSLAGGLAGLGDSGLAIHAQLYAQGHPQRRAKAWAPARFRRYRASGVRRMARANGQRRPGPGQSPEQGFGRATALAQERSPRSGSCPLRTGPATKD